MTDMAALLAHRRGGPEVLAFDRAPVPVPAHGEVSIAVHAAAITFDELAPQETWLRDGAQVPGLGAAPVIDACTDDLVVTWPGLRRGHRHRRREGRGLGDGRAAFEGGRRAHRRPGTTVLIVRDQ